MIRIISSPHRDIAPVRSFSARLILGGCQSKHRPDRLGLPEASRYIDGDTKGQCDHRSNAGDGHQAPAHVIVPDDGQQAAMQDAELLANDPPDNEQRFHQHGQIGKAFDKLPDTRLELHRPDHADLETEVAQAGAQIVLDGNGLRCSSLRWVSSTRSFWLRNVFTCTGRYSPARIICAMPRASLRSVLLICAFSTA